MSSMQELPVTGVSVGILAVIGGGILAFGALLAAMARRGARRVG